MMPGRLFQKENAELLVSVSKLSLTALDRMMSAMPPGEALPAGEMAAITRLINGALHMGLEGNGPPRRPLPRKPRKR